MKDIHTDLLLISKIPFTPREVDVAACVAFGRKSDKQIADMLSLEKKIAKKTVEKHISSFLKKIGGKTKKDIISFIEESDKSDVIRKFYEDRFHKSDAKRGVNTPSNRNIIFIFLFGSYKKRVGRCGLN